MTKLTTRAMNNFVHILPYYKNNSPVGIALAGKTKKRIDLDFQRTKDNVWVNTHWARLSKERFRYTRESVAAGIPASKVGVVCDRLVSDLTWKVVKTLETSDGYRIQTASSAFALCAKRGVSIELEVKFIPTLRMYWNLRSAAKKFFGTNWKNMVHIKRLRNLTGWRTTLFRAKTAGFITILIRAGSGPYPRYVNYVRK